ncbi:MAG: hypothetical protein SFU25_03215, partial [Candidatus Caenarcaniphilales bacterium]|nr:hypothetical protein [Candidatus Caenarcaniphilales bacterium]
LKFKNHCKELGFSHEDFSRLSSHLIDNWNSILEQESGTINELLSRNEDLKTIWSSINVALHLVDSSFKEIQGINDLPFFRFYKQLKVPLREIIASESLRRNLQSVLSKILVQTNLLEA